MSEGLPIVPIEVLIYTKLMAKRWRDLADVVELVKAGADLNRVCGSTSLNMPVIWFHHLKSW